MTILVSDQLDFDLNKFYCLFIGAETPLKKRWYRRLGLTFSSPSEWYVLLHFLVICFLLEIWAFDIFQGKFLSTLCTNMHQSGGAIWQYLCNINKLLLINIDHRWWSKIDFPLRGSKFIKKQNYQKRY